MLKILQQYVEAKLQQYVNWELPDVQAGFRKGRGVRDQIASIHCIIEKAKEFQEKKKKDIYFCFIVCVKDFDCELWITTNWKILKDVNNIPPFMPPKKPIWRSRSNS